MTCSALVRQASICFEADNPSGPLRQDPLFQCLSGWYFCRED
jgi:hypothetical protein